MARLWSGRELFQRIFWHCLNSVGSRRTMLAYSGTAKLLMITLLSFDMGARYWHNLTHGHVGPAQRRAM